MFVEIYKKFDDVRKFFHKKIVYRDRVKDKQIDTGVEIQCFCGNFQCSRVSTTYDNKFERLGTHIDLNNDVRDIFTVNNVDFAISYYSLHFLPIKSSFAIECLKVLMGYIGQVLHYSIGIHQNVGLNDSTADFLCRVEISYNNYSDIFTKLADTMSKIKTSKSIYGYKVHSKAQVYDYYSGFKDSYFMDHMDTILGNRSFFEDIPDDLPKLSVGLQLYAIIAIATLKNCTDTFIKKYENIGSVERVLTKDQKNHRSIDFHINDLLTYLLKENV
jgi:hypothetical protein